MKLFAKFQEACRKDVERAFGVLQARFTIIRDGVRLWEMKDLRNVMLACIILHNMIIDDEKDDDDNVRVNFVGSLPPQNRSNFQTYIQRTLQITDAQTHSRLKSDLIEDLWKFHGENEN